MLEVESGRAEEHVMEGPEECMSFYGMQTMMVTGSLQPHKGSLRLHLVVIMGHWVGYGWLLCMDHWRVGPVAPGADVDGKVWVCSL